MGKKTWTYVVGDKEAGVLFLTLDPVRVSLVTRVEIERYAKRNGITFEAAFGEVAGAAQDLILATDINDDLPGGQVTRQVFSGLVARGTVISDADFCFLAEVDSGNWGTLRNGFMPIEGAITALTDYDGGPVPEAPLEGPN